MTKSTRVLQAALWSATIAMVLLAIVIGGSRLGGRPAQAQVATVVPTVIPAPSPSATPTPVATTLHCVCYTPGQPATWSGYVQSPTYYQARQLAAQECLAYLGITPESPYINPSPTPTPAIPNYLLPANGVCTNCACN